MTEKLKVPVLLEQYPGEGWTCYVPRVDGCMSEGDSIEQAKEGIVPEIEYFANRHPEILDILKNSAIYQISEVEVDLNNVSKNARDSA